ncbi:hypothetical protein O6H91_23G043200 [Diphasiastrum complanatum]|uniref:Uncharacterized protein n=1 Tax=Diphasiastrum complanatum TaxID=34168 RepID=A0ACC2AA46_DIPCM|nr:hypothetical protein O6H91_23G043200 [Diphasiastrum complanatum]
MALPTVMMLGRRLACDAPLLSTKRVLSPPPPRTSRSPPRPTCRNGWLLLCLCIRVHQQVSPLCLRPHLLVLLCISLNPLLPPPHSLPRASLHPPSPRHLPPQPSPSASLSSSAAVKPVR